MPTRFLRASYRALLVLAAVAASAASADPGRADLAPSLGGVVRDTAGTPLPHAQVVIIGLNRGTSTNPSGEFFFDAVTPGRYEVYATLIGYAPSRVAVVVPESSNDPVRITITLRATALQLPGIEITATRVATDPLDLTQSTVELSGQALSRRVSSSVAQTLASEPGVSQRFSGPAANMPVIRGLTDDRIVVLENGERSGDLASSAPDHGVTIDPLRARQIEVVRGPAALQYGNNAIGGVVNVITQEIPTAVPNHVEGYFASQVESVNPGGAFAASATVPLGRAVAINAHGGTRASDDMRVGGGGTLLNSYSRSTNAGAAVGVIRERFTSGLSFAATGFRYGLPGAPEDDELGAFIAGSRQQVTGRTDFRLAGRAVTAIRLDGTLQWYGHNEIEPSGEVGTRFDLKTQTANAIARTRMGSVAGAVGVGGLFKQYAPFGEEALTPAADTRSGGIFVFQDIPLVAGDTAKVPHLHIGARYDTYRMDPKGDDPRFGSPEAREFQNFSGSIGATYPMSSDVSLNANVSRAFRAPTVEELYSNGVHAARGTFEIGNQDLSSETNTGGEILLRIRRPRVSSQLSAFYNRIENYVILDFVRDTIVDGSSMPLALYTQGDATLQGFEGEIEAEVFPRIVAGFMGDLVLGRLKSDEPLPFMPATRAGARARYDDGRFSAGFDYRHVFAQDDVPVAATEDDPSAVATAAYDLLDLSAGWTLIRGGLVHNITFRLDNALDKRYREATSRIKHFAFNPGRNVSLVYRVLF
ncbi:MAG: TonB-dependent receptor [Gemmatimonadaceae bacterium]|nr:TonB-dependent receptor [Gemmatimonadaceae bacterium]